MPCWRRPTLLGHVACFNAISRQSTPRQRQGSRRQADLNLGPSGALRTPNVWQMFGNVAPHFTAVHGNPGNTLIVEDPPAPEMNHGSGTPEGPAVVLGLSGCQNAPRPRCLPRR